MARQQMSKKELIAIQGPWKSLFFREIKERTGKYSLPDLSDWGTLATIKSDTWFDAQAQIRYEAEEVPGDLYLWTVERGGIRLQNEKPDITELFQFLSEESADAIYLARIDGQTPWTFVITHEDFPCRFIFGKKCRPD